MGNISHKWHVITLVLNEVATAFSNAVESLLTA